MSDPERTRFLPLERPYPEDRIYEWLRDRLLHWERHDFGTFMVREKGSEENIGYCGLEYVKKFAFIDVLYGLVQDRWGKGYAFEAASFCVKYGFEALKLETIYGAAIPENTASIHILKKIGMKPDSRFDCYGDMLESYSIKKDRIKS